LAPVQLAPASPPQVAPSPATVRLTALSSGTAVEKELALIAFSVFLPGSLV
jgi:hypothetical protein